MRKLRQVLLKTKRLFIFSICFIMCVFTFQPATVSKAIAAQNNVELNASLNDRSILVESKSIDDTQIWGYYHHHWFIMKDYGEDGSLDENRYAIDISPYLLNSGSVLDMRYDSMQSNLNILKLYVKYKRNSNNYRELFKTFYLDDTNRLAVKLESDGDMDATYDYPISAKVGIAVKFYLQTSENYNDYKVNILGAGSYKENASIVKKDSNDVQQVFSWTPTESGTFNATVYKGNTIILQRKVYVNSRNEKYLKVHDLNIKSSNNSNNTVDVVFQIEDKIDDNTRCGGKNSIEKVSQLVISEPFIWSKTLFNDNYIKPGTGKNALSGLELGSGKYYFNASVKTANSLEKDDAITDTYKANDGMGDASNLSVACTLEGNPVDIYDQNQLSYTVTGSALHFNFNITGESNTIDQYEYAFILFNKRGHVVKVGYDSQQSSFDWNPSTSGTYIIKIRMRNKDNRKNEIGLDNSYVKQVTIPITIKQPSVDCKIDSVEINNNMWEVNEDGISGGQDYKVHSRSLTSIQINTVEKKDDYMYKVYVSNKGCYYALTPYTYSNSIPFYPKTDGIYHMIVLVKDDSSGSYEDRCEFDVNVTTREIMN